MSSKLFFVDSREGVSKTYDDLIVDIHEQTTYSKYVQEASFYEIFKEIIVSILLKEEIVLLDSDYTDSEVESLIGDLSGEKRSVHDVNLKYVTLNSLREALAAQTSPWKVTLFTSGTTGRPKQVSHSLRSIARNVKISDRHKKDVWGFAYSPTHMAGLQVFFQALMNFNVLIRIFGYSRDDIYNNIFNYKITNISATPTFYRLLLPADREAPTVCRITSGGEKFDSETEVELKKIFVNAKFTNVYASTEAGSLFASKGDAFVIKDELRPFVKFENGELLLHKSLLGDSDSIKLEGDWFATGDLAQIIDENPLTFKFISRKTEMINVGGYKVNPTEVEAAIRRYPGVKDAYVYSKANRILGNIIMCDIVCLKGSDVIEKELRAFLAKELQEYKIPRFFNFVDDIAVNQTGKKFRKNN